MSNLRHKRTLLTVWFFLGRFQVLFLSYFMSMLILLVGNVFQYILHSAQTVTLERHSFSRSLGHDGVWVVVHSRLESWIFEVTDLSLIGAGWGFKSISGHIFKVFSVFLPEVKRWVIFLVWMSIFEEARFSILHILVIIIL